MARTALHPRGPCAHTRPPHPTQPGQGHSPGPASADRGHHTDTEEQAAATRGRQASGRRQAEAAALRAAASERPSRAWTQLSAGPGPSAARPCVGGAVAPGAEHLCPGLGEGGAGSGMRHPGVRRWRRAWQGRCLFHRKSACGPHPRVQSKAGGGLSAGRTEVLRKDMAAADQPPARPQTGCHPATGRLCWRRAQPPGQQRTRGTAVLPWWPESQLPLHAPGVRQTAPRWSGQGQPRASGRTPPGEAQLLSSGT